MRKIWQQQQQQSQSLNNKKQQQQQMNEWMAPTTFFVCLFLEMCRRFSKWKKNEKKMKMKILKDGKKREKGRERWKKERK